MLPDLSQAVIRTIVPVIVAAIASLALRLGVHLDNTGPLADLVGALVGGAYYSLVLWAEQKWPQIGWLLGKPGSPSYGDAQA
jgi:hypothetical protein